MIYKKSFLEEVIKMRDYLYKVGVNVTSMDNAIKEIRSKQPENWKLYKNNFICRRFNYER